MPRANCSLGINKSWNDSHLKHWYMKMKKTSIETVCMNTTRRVCIRQKRLPFMSMAVAEAWLSCWIRSILNNIQHIIVYTWNTFTAAALTRRLKVSVISEYLEEYDITSLSPLCSYPRSLSIWMFSLQYLIIGVVIDLVTFSGVSMITILFK